MIRSTRFRRALWLLPLAGAAVWVVAQNVALVPSPLPAFPPGAILTLEARDAGALLREWNASGVKTAWLASDAYRQFAVSRLGQRLEEARQEFAAAAGFDIDMTFAGQVAGGRAALAIYNPGDLEMLLVTRVPAARFAAGALGLRRASLSPRNAGGTPYYVATSSGSNRAVAFALRGEWLVAGTTDALVAEYLQRAAANSPGGLAAEPWHSRAANLAGEPGELRLTADLDALQRSPYFRSYWIHRNREALRPYIASVSDLTRETGRWTERRLRVRREESAPAVDASRWPQLLASIPAAAGLYRAWLSPASEEAEQLVATKLLDPRPGVAFASGESAPLPAGFALPSDSGDEPTWEDRIDEAPFVPGESPLNLEPLRRFLANGKPDGMVHVASTFDSPDGVWIQVEDGVVLTRRGGWNLAEVRTLLSGITPRTVHAGVEGERLLLASSAELLAALRGPGAGLAAPNAGTVFLGGFRHSRERARGLRWMARIDQPSAVPPEPGETRPPQFLGDIAGGLSTALRHVSEHTVSREERPAATAETIVYRME